MSTKPRGVHLVGSVPLDSEEQVFHVVGRALGRHLRRIPDGETGGRKDWVQFELFRLGERPDFELVPFRLEGVVEEAMTLRLRDRVAAGEADFGDLGYAEMATRSFDAFRRAQAAGDVPVDVRFQVSMPTPLANATTCFVSNPDFGVLNRRYEAAMIEELGRIADAIPAGQLAVQWDVCYEVLMYEGWMPMPPGIDRGWIADHLVRLADAVPADVELGLHFCFGDYQHQHFQQPTDVGRVVELANDVLPRVRRPIQFLHVPVPIERDDDAYFAPLRDLRLPDGTELYLGLVHFRDGSDGAQRRITAAARLVPGFGVATECGWGRRPEGRGGGRDLQELIDLHRELAEPVR